MNRPRLPATNKPHGWLFRSPVTRSPGDVYGIRPTGPPTVTRRAPAAAGGGHDYFISGNDAKAERGLERELRRKTRAYSARNRIDLSPVNSADVGLFVRGVNGGASAPGEIDIGSARAADRERGKTSARKTMRLGDPSAVIRREGAPPHTGG